METWTFLYHSRYPSPNSPCEHGQEELGMNILHQCEGPPGPSLHAQELGWLGFSRPPLAFPLLPIPAIDLPCFSLSLPHPLYLLFIFLHRFCILFICLSFHLISPILKGLSGEERASPASPSSICQIRPGVRFYLTKGK